MKKKKKLESIKLDKFKENELSKLDKIGGAPPGTYREGATVFFSYLTASYDRNWDFTPDGGGDFPPIGQS